nr:deoxyribodipyrimidine photo-lyase [Thioalkalivibrio sp. AKL10]
MFQSPYRIPEPVHLVWFKRDLRVDDHAPLHHAAQAGPILPLYIVAPGYWELSDTSRRHWDFVRASLLELDQAVSERGRPLVVREGDAVEVLEQLREEIPVVSVYSHQETGNRWTDDRDGAVAHLFRHRGIPWREYRQHGVVRGLRNRDGWVSQWEELMRESAFVPPGALAAGPAVAGGVERLPRCPKGVVADAVTELQEPGSEAGRGVMRDLLRERGQR